MRRFLSVIAALVGAGVIAYSVYLMTIGRFSGDNLTGNILFLVVGAVLLAVGIWGNLAASVKKRDLSKEQRTPDKGKHRTAIILISALAAFAVFGLALPVALTLVSEEQTETRTEEWIRPMMKDEYTHIGVPLPDNARYILYNVNEQNFETDGRTVLKGISGNPDKVNVVVAYQTSTSAIGVWKTENGVSIASAYEESMKISVIRLSDWSLVEERTFAAVSSENRLGKGDKKYTYQVSLYDSEIIEYLNGLFDN